MTDTVVSAREVTKVFGSGEAENTVLKGVSFDVAEGEFVSVMGPSGCGKSTLLYLIGGLEKPTSGKLLTCGQELSSLGDREQSRVRCRDIGFVFQFYNLGNLWKDINIALENDIKLLNIATEPVSVADIYEALTAGGKFDNQVALNPPYYNYKSVHADLFGGRDERGVLPGKKVPRRTDIIRFSFSIFYFLSG